MTRPAPTVGPNPPGDGPGGAYGQRDIAPAAQKSKIATTRPNETDRAPASPAGEAVSPPDAPAKP